MNYSIVFGQCTMKQFQLSNVMCENFHSCNSLATHCGYNILALAWGKQFYRQPFYIDCLPSYHVSRSSWQIETRGKTFLSHKLPPVSNHPVPGKNAGPLATELLELFFSPPKTKSSLSHQTGKGAWLPCCVVFWLHAQHPIRFPGEECTVYRSVYFFPSLVGIPGEWLTAAAAAAFGEFREEVGKHYHYPAGRTKHF